MHRLPLPWKRHVLKRIWMQDFRYCLLVYLYIDEQNCKGLSAKSEGRGKGIGEERSLHFGRDDNYLCLTAIAKYAAGILPSVAEESLCLYNK